MRIRSIIAIAVALLAAFVFYPAPISAQSPGKSLVVYFSHTGENYAVGTITEGNTAIIAKMIAQEAGADTFEIIPEKDYPAKYKECTDVAKEEQKKNARPAYKGDIDTAGYETIYIGYPIWWGDLPMVVYSFLEKHDLNGKTLVPFCTHEGSGISGTDNKIKKLYQGATVTKGLALRGSTAQNKRSDAKKSVEDWLKQIKK